MSEAAAVEGDSGKRGGRGDGAGEHGRDETDCQGLRSQRRGSGNGFFMTAGSTWAVTQTGVTAYRAE